MAQKSLGIVKPGELYTYPIVRMKNFLNENNKYIKLSKEQLTKETKESFLSEYTRRISRFADKLLKYNIDDSIHVINKETNDNFIGLFLKDNNEKREYLHVRFIIAAADSTCVATHYRLICTEKKRRNN